MKFLPWILLAGVTFFGATCYSQTAAVSYESITVTDAAVGIGSGTLTYVMAGGACSGRLEDAQIRFRVDGTDPTAAEGVLLEIGDTITVTTLRNITQFKAIRTGAVSGTLKIHCFQ